MPKEFVEEEMVSRKGFECFLLSFFQVPRFKQDERPLEKKDREPDIIRKSPVEPPQIGKSAFVVFEFDKKLRQKELNPQLSS